MTPRTKAGADLLAELPDTIAGGAPYEYVRAIEDEMLDKVVAAVEGLDEYGEWCTDGHRGHWVGAVTKKPVLAAIERIRRDDDGR